MKKFSKTTALVPAAFLFVESLHITRSNGKKASRSQLIESRDAAVWDNRAFRMECQV